MSGISEHFAKVAGEFTRRAVAVPAGAWDDPAPCEGWVARDVARHRVEWKAMVDTIQSKLEDPEVATGLDERLDPDEVHRMLVAMEPIDEMLRQSGHYGPRVIVPDNADEQTRLIAFTGRHP